MLFAALLAAAGLWAYANSLDGVFVLDDVPGVVQNESIRGAPGLRWLMAPPGSTPSGRPLLNVSLALNYAAGGLDVRGYHAVNVGLHLLAAIVLFAVLHRTFASSRLAGAFAVHARPVAFAIAVLWVVHPLTTGAVTYIVQRGEILMALFCLLTIYCAIRGWTWAAVAACAAGMASKETMVAVPLLVVLWDHLFLPEGARRRGLYAALAATWVVLALPMLGGTQGGTIVSRALGLTAKHAGDPWTPLSYLWTQAEVIVHYAALAVKPWPLAFDYYGWPRAATLLAALPEVLLAASACALTVWGLRRRSAAAFAGAVFFLVLAPTSSVIPIPTEIAAEHRMYLPVAALLALLVAAAYRWIPAGGRTLAAALLLVVIAGFAQLTRVRNRDYASAEELWQRTVETRPGNARARINYGIELMKTARPAQAEAQMRAALPLEMDPETRGQVYLQLGAALSVQQRFDEGIPALQRALEIDPAIKEADGMLAQAYADRGDERNALRHYERALDRHPDTALILRRYAWLLATARDLSLRDPHKAIALAERAVAMGNGADAVAFETAAAAYASAGRRGDAVAAVDRALDLARRRGDPRSVELYERQRAYYAGK